MFTIFNTYGTQSFYSLFPGILPASPWKNLNSISPSRRITKPQIYPRYTTAINALNTNANGLAATSTAIAALLEDCEGALDVDELPDEPDVLVAVPVALEEVVFKFAILIVVFLLMGIPVAPELTPLPTAPVPKGTKAVVVAFFFAAVKLAIVELIDAIAAWRLVAEGEFVELVMVEMRDREVVPGELDPPLKVNMPE